MAIRGLTRQNRQSLRDPASLKSQCKFTGGRGQYGLNYRDRHRIRHKRNVACSFPCSCPSRNLERARFWRSYVHYSAFALAARLADLPVRRTVSPSLVQKLWTRDDCFHQTAEGMAIRRQLGPHLVERLLVRQRQTAAEGVGEHLFAQIVDEIILPFVVQIFAQTLESAAILAIRERGARLDR